MHGHADLSPLSLLPSCLQLIFRLCAYMSVVSSVIINLLLTADFSVTCLHVRCLLRYY